MSHPVSTPLEGSWNVEHEGTAVAAIRVNEERGGVVVTADIACTNEKAKPYRFETLEDADGFLRDLLTSFAFLGCDVAAAG